MKKCIAILMAIAFLFVAPFSGIAGDTTTSSNDLGQKVEDVGTTFFSYMHQLVQMPIDLTEKAVRALLFMDHK